MLSPDNEFSPIGNLTNINYLEDFNLYKRILLANLPRVESLFTWFNKKVFSPNSKRNSRSGSSESSDEEEDTENFDELLRAFNGATVSVDIRSADLTPEAILSITPTTSTPENPMDDSEANHMQSSRSRSRKTRRR